MAVRSDVWDNVIWSTATADNVYGNAASCIVNNDGNVVLQRPVWATGVVKASPARKADTGVVMGKGSHEKTDIKIYYSY